jgi:hypothetical protein
MLLSESKKNESVRRLLSKYPEEDRLIRSIFDISNYGSLYSEYLEEMVDSILDSYGYNLSEFTENYVYGLFSFFLPWFDRNKNNISKDDILNAVKKYKLSNDKDIPNINNILSNPSNINNYTNIDFVKNLIEVVESNRPKRKSIEGFKSDSEVLFQNSDGEMVIHLKTLKSTCYYNKQAKWCKLNETDFYKLIRDGELYLVIDSVKIKTFIYINNTNGDTIALDRYGNPSYYANIPKYLRSKVPKLTTFKGLRYISKGKTKKTKYYFDDIDPDIEYVEYEFPFGTSKVFLKKELVYNCLNIADYESHVFRDIMNGTYDSDRSYESMQQDFLDGYDPFYSLDDENSDILSKIEIIILGRTLDSKDDSDDRLDFNKALYGLFEGYINDIFYAYQEESNNQINESAREDLEYELAKSVAELGINFDDEDKYASSTVSNLIFKYVTSGNIKVGLKELFESINVDFDFDFDNIHEYSDYTKMDLVSLNREINRSLSRILDELESDESNSSIKLFRYISDKFKFNTWYDLPSDKSIMFKIDGLDQPNKKINVHLKKKNNQYTIKRHKFTEEDFNKFLYNPEIFSIFDN